MPPAATICAWRPWNTPPSWKRSGGRSRTLHALRSDCTSPTLGRVCPAEALASLRREGVVRASANPVPVRRSRKLLSEHFSRAVHHQDHSLTIEGEGEGESDLGVEMAEYVGMDMHRARVDPRTRTIGLIVISREGVDTVPAHAEGDAGNGAVKPL